jgi:hypothetical protein
MPSDIRDNSADTYWSDFDRKWSGLLSYRYLGRQNKVLDAGVEGTADSDFQVMTLRRDMRNPHGGLMAAPLCIAAPEAGGMQDDHYIPNPLAASLQILDPGADVRAIHTHSETIRLGRTTGFSRTRIVDADDESRVLALSEGLAISLGTPPEGFTPVEVPPLEIADSPDLPPLHEVFGARRRGDGTWFLAALGDDLASPDGALHLGPIHIVLETAATELAAGLIARERLQIDSWHVMFEARGKVGPFPARGEVFPAPGGRVGVRVDLHDEGNGHRVVATASATFHAVPGGRS